MQSRLAALLAALAAASSASAEVNYLAAMPAALNTPHALLPRQTGGASPTIPTECYSAIVSLFSSCPPRPEVQSALEADLARKPPADLCSFTTPPNLSAQFSSYSSQLDSWSSRNANQLTACSNLPNINAFSACGSDRSSSTPAANAVSSSTRSGNAPARQNGMAAAAVVAFGLAVAIL
ncbi:uncharacterized protein HRG_11982 [Hirsutella rhossiliensis]|uniref:Infection structure specific protein n=1 Tax=Hirsutella rhossiliensis TaxID=111463 RepID=A0A9P8SDE1_9HYPO|nr:uncharacterized protein HRG_11982 [Hirsutella rhossiliensis]KAH0956946.1 hypothetical protein HRG_11982 [Hirsutella rhossiliensis]